MSGRRLYRFAPGPRGGFRSRYVWVRPTYTPGLETPGLLLDWLSDDQGSWWALVHRLRDATTPSTGVPAAAVTEIVAAEDIRGTPRFDPPGPNGHGLPVTAESRHVWVRPPHLSSYCPGLVLQLAMDAPYTPIALVAYVPGVEHGEAAILFWATRGELAGVPARPPAAR
ncbi:hypothetical protein KVF89_22285 [Nocardioides carbamazepini]|uniref:hypothetical protein n=1 Tax=Nocardioides carbamazepini TaxID=2854259 RepID=UPI0021499BEF|nr:hypothetical protein [Nocardioides carbamazepini]MCR1785285.1 hypothetical protein [Nocardioides carbamazepini]